MDIEIQYRPITEDDMSFILNSWLKSYRNSEFAKDLANPVYFENHSKIIQHLLAKSNVIIACNPEELTQIYGYSVFEQYESVTILHYIYVKFPYRKFGIAKNLFSFAQPDPKEFTLISHIPRNLDKLSKKFNLIFDLYRII